MGMCGGGGGYSTSNQESQPWDVQAKYLSPLFRSSFVSMYGTDPQGNGNDKLTPEEQAKFNNQFAGVDANGNPLPGQIQYYGNPTIWNSGPGGNIGLNSNLQTTKAANVAGFSPEEMAAQDAMIARAQGRSTVDTGIGTINTGYSNLIPQSKTAMSGIITGQNRINPASMSAQSVGLIPQVQNPYISMPQGMNTPQIGNTDLGYQYWNQLGNMASGSNQNPYLEQMISNSNRNLTRDFYNYQLPSLDSTAELAGRYGGNTWGNLRNDAYDTYLQNMGQNEANMRGQAYNTNQANALGAMNTGGNLAATQSGYNADRASQQAQMDLARQSQQYNTAADIGKTQAELGLQAQTSNAGNELQRLIQNAMFGQEAGKTNSEYQQQANIGNIENIMQGAGMAAPIAQADYNDIANLAASGESKSSKWQDVIDAFVNQFQTQQMEPYQRASLMSNLLSGDFGGNVMSTGNQTSSGGCF